MDGHSPERVRVRDATPSDMTDLIAVERDACGPVAWPADTPALWLGMKNAAALVAETDGDGVVGFVAYRVDPGGVVIMDIAVDRGWQRRGVASDLIVHLAGRFPHEPLACFSLRHLTGLHACLRANGFYVSSVLRHLDVFCHWLDVSPPCQRGRDYLRVVFHASRVRLSVGAARARAGGGR